MGCLTFGLSAARRGARLFGLGVSLVLLVCTLGAQASYAADGKALIEPPAKYVKSGQITYCSQLDNPPHDFLNEKGQPDGLDVDLAKRMASLLGLKPQWLHLQFSAMIPALQAGQCDMIVEELYMRPAREKIIDFIPFAISAEQIAVRKGNQQGIKTIADLSGKKVAVATGTTFQTLMDEENKKLKAEGKPLIDILAVTNQNDAYNLVVAQNADAIGATLAAVAYHHQITGGLIVAAGEPFHEIKDGFGFRKDDPELRAAMEKALDHLVKNGEYTAIFKKYGMEAAAIH